MSPTVDGEPRAFVCGLPANIIDTHYPQHVSTPELMRFLACEFDMAGQSARENWWVGVNLESEQAEPEAAAIALCQYAGLSEIRAYVARLAMDELRRRLDMDEMPIAH